MHRRKAAKSLLKLARLSQVKEAFSTFISPDFIHPSQYFQGSREALEKAMEEVHETIVSSCERMLSTNDSKQ